MFSKDIDFGDLAMDRVTRFEGVVTGKIEYINGCRQALLAPQVGDDGKWADAHWFDFERIEVTEKGAVSIEAGEVGGAGDPSEAPPVR